MVGFRQIAVAVLLLSPATADARAAEFTVAERTIQFPLPEGYCWLQPSDPMQGAALDQMRAAQAGFNELIGMYALCAEAASLSAGDAAGLDHYGVLVANKRDGTVQPVADAARKDVLGALRETFGEAGMAAEMEKAREVLQTQGVTLADMQSPRLVHADDFALYSTMTTRVSGAGDSSQIASIFAFTFVNQLVLFNYVYAPAEDPQVLDKLLAMQQKLMADFVALNETAEEQARQSDSSRGLFGIDWSEVGVKALIGALVGGLIAVTVAAVKRFRKAS